MLTRTVVLLASTLRNTPHGTRSMNQHLKALTPLPTEGKHQNQQVAV